MPLYLSICLSLHCAIIKPQAAGYVVPINVVVVDVAFPGDDVPFVIAPRTRARAPDHMHTRE